MIFNAPKYISVLLSGRNGNIKKNWRCGECGSIVFSYFSRIDVFIDGKLEPESSTIDVQCRHCKTFYRIV